MAIMYDLLELNALPTGGDVLGVPGIGADVEFLLTETTAEVPDDYYSVALDEIVEAGFHVGSNGTFPADIDGITYSTTGLYDVTYDLDGTSYTGFIAVAVPVGGGAARYFFLPEDGVDPAINQLTITSMTSVIFVDADNAAIDDTVTFVVCFAAGTQLATPAGPRAVEYLGEGDLVDTLDSGPQPILWASETRITEAELAQDHRLRAIEIDKGALGDGMPRRRLRVSRQHRLLLKSQIALRMFGSDEVLLAAKDLLDFQGVRHAPVDGDMRFFHFLLPCHSVLLAEGTGAESLWLGQEATHMLGGAAVGQARHRLYAQQKLARQFVAGARAKSLVARHVRNRRCLWDAPTLQCPTVDSCKADTLTASGAMEFGQARAKFTRTTIRPVVAPAP